MDFRFKERLLSFTLIELVLVLLIIGVLAAISFPRLTRSSYHKMIQSEARRLESFIDYVQTKSRIDRQDYKIFFDFEENAYWYTTQKDNVEILSKKNKIHPSLYIKNKADAVIWFYPDRTSSGKLAVEINDITGNYTLLLEKTEGVSRLDVKEIKLK